MSYAQLAGHATKFEESAVKADLAQQGYRVSGDIVLHHRQTAFEIESAVKRTQGKFAGVADIFGPFLSLPNPDDFPPISKELAGVASLLNVDDADLKTSGTAVVTNPALGKMNDVSGMLSDWRGAAAVQFRDNFLSTWPGITANQFALVMALRGAVEAEHGLWTAARADVDRIAHQAQAALDSMLECNPKHISFALTVAGSVLAVAALPLSGGLSASIVVLSEAASSAGAYPLAEKEELPLSGGSASEIVKNTQNALNALTAQIVSTERKILDALSGTLQTVAANREKFVAPRPVLADMSSSNIRDSKVGIGFAVG